MTLVGCYSNNCPMDNRVTCNYCFYNTQGEAIKYAPAITVSAILPGSKTVYVYRKMGDMIISETKRPDLTQQAYVETEQIYRNDTILINKLSNARNLEIPMSYFHESDTLLFRYSNIVQPDTIFVGHESFAHVDLPECGSFRYHRLTNVRATDNAIDHIEIVNTTVNYDKQENIKIYFNELANDQ